MFICRRDQQVFSFLFVCLLFFACLFDWLIGRLVDWLAGWFVFGESLCKKNRARSKLADERLLRAVFTSLRTVLVSVESATLLARKVHHDACQRDAENARDSETCQESVQPVPETRARKRK